ncbi:retrovirus-related pol polyprotein from transposon TNT 1-94 [Tanacetum coccineum]
MEETVHVTFSEDDEAISQSSTEGDIINFNENRSFLDDEFLEPKSKVTQCPGNIEYFPYIPTYESTTPTDLLILQDYVSPKESIEFTKADDPPALNELDQPESADDLEPAKIQDIFIMEPISDVQPLPIISPSDEELVNIIGEPLAGIKIRSRVRDSDVASSHECMYVNFLYEMEPKKLIEALEEEGWIIVVQEELNQLKRNKEWINYEETFTLVARLEAIRIFLVYAAYMDFMVYKMDVKNAFLNGKISKEVYVQQPLGF